MAKIQIINGCKLSFNRQLIVNKYAINHLFAGYGQ